MSFTTLLIAGFLFGIGFGYFVQRAGLCFAHGLTEVYMGMGKRIFRLFFIIFIITSIGFLASAMVRPGLGLKAVGQIRGHGFFNVLSGMLFGAGIVLNGGCILGTLRQIGEGNMTFLIVLVSFIPGMAVVVYGLDPLFLTASKEANALLPSLFQCNGWLVTGALVILCIAGLRAVMVQTNKKS